MAPLSPLVVVVHADVELRVRRLVEQRSMVASRRPGTGRCAGVATSGVTVGVSAGRLRAGRG